MQIKNIPKQFTDFVQRLSDLRFAGQVLFVIIVLLISWSGIKTIQTNYGLQKQISSLFKRFRQKSMTLIVILQNIFFGVLSFIPFIAMVGGFEYAYQKKANEQNERTIQFRKRFYKVSAWLGTYFPIRLLAMALVHFYPRPINSLALECVIAVLYLMTATLITLEIEKRHLSKN